MVDKNEVKKELYKTKEMANFSHYVSGNLYYTVELSSGRFQFPISTVDTVLHVHEDEDEYEELVLSYDLGETVFKAEIKGSELIRWITRAIDSGEFKEIKICDSEKAIDTLSKNELIEIIKKM